MRYIALINIICALLNISFAEGLDGEHAMSSLIGTLVIDVAKANILQMTTRKNRKKYFSRMGITGVANVCTSVLIIGFQLIIPIFILTNICIFIESLILWGIV